MSDLTTAANVRAYLGVHDGEHDAAIGRIVAAVSAEVERWCNQPIKAREIAHRFYGPLNGLRVRLPFSPVVSVGALTFANAIGEDPTTVATDLYELANIDGAWMLRGAFTEAAFYTLNLTVGYAVVPADVEQVVIEMCAVRLRDSGIQTVGKSTLGKKTDATSQQGMTRTTLYERPDWQERLSPYRVMTI